MIIICYDMLKSHCWLCQNWPECGFFSGWCLILPHASSPPSYPLPPPPTFHRLFCSSHAKLARLASAAGAHRKRVWLHLSCHCVTSIVFVLTGCKSSVGPSLVWRPDWIMHEAWVKNGTDVVSSVNLFFILCSAKLKYWQPLLLFWTNYVKIMRNSLGCSAPGVSNEAAARARKSSFCSFFFLAFYYLISCSYLMSVHTTV